MEAPREDFIEWWASVEKSLLRRLRSRAVADDVAADIVQDVAVRLIREAQQIGYDRVVAERSVGWCLKLAHWLLIDRIRLQKREQVLGPDTWSQILKYAATQEKSFFFRELADLIDALPPQQREATLGKLWGFSAKEIALSLKIDESTVRSLQRFARNRLASELGA